MKKLIAWIIDNTPAMNTLMVAVLMVGAFSLITMRREIFPQFELEIITISVPYPGTSPDEIEEGICQKIEEAVSSVEGIKKLTATASEGVGTVVVELESNVDPQKSLNEIKNEIDRIPNFPPELAEEPVVKQITIREAAINLGVIGPDYEPGDVKAELELRNLTERLRDDLKSFRGTEAQLVDVPEDAGPLKKLVLNISNLSEKKRAEKEQAAGPVVNQVDVLGGRPYEIDVEIPENTLRKYGLTLSDAAMMIRNRNLELPGGTMRAESQEVLLRAKNKGLTGEEIAKLPLITQPGGVVLTVGDLGNVRDEFADTTAITRIDGKPALILSVTKTQAEDMLKITDAVRKFAEMKQSELPPGYELKIFFDMSQHVRDRLELMLRNGFQGLVLVFIILALFLELRLAGWVALGIPISMMGAGIIMVMLGQTLNMLSMFAFILTLGILVDDAIVVGENIYYHRGGKTKYRQAAIAGTAEVMPSITTSVLTTMMAFTPMFLVPGILGKFISIIPIAVVSMLAVSLFESLFILPCHLAHEPKEKLSVRFGRKLDGMSLVARYSVGYPLWSLLKVKDFMLYPFSKVYVVTRWINRHMTDGLEWFSSNLYIPLLRRSLNWPTLTVAIGVTILLLTIGSVMGGFVPYTTFPKGDAVMVDAAISFPDGTPASVTDAATRRLEEAIERVNQRGIEKTGNPIMKLSYRMVGSSSDGQMENGSSGGPNGSHRGKVTIELTESDMREWTSQEIEGLWRDEAGDFPGADQLTFSGREGGPGGKAIEFKLLARPEHMAELEEAVELCKQKLKTLEGVLDVVDDSTPGKIEYQITVKDSAKSLGITERDLGNTIRASYYGEEVMRLQRGRHEVKLMVRYPEEERESLANFDDIRVRLNDRAERPLTELADVNVARGYSQILRQNQLRAITITADCRVMSDATERVEEMTRYVNGLMKEPRFANITVDWQGQKEQDAESMQGLMIGLAVALCAMFGILTLEFKSYTQPAIIMVTIPFGVVGAIVGHWIMGLDVTIMSMFGLVALTGVVVNDSIVLIDFINHQVREKDHPIMESLLDAGRRRLRPVLLTSATTIFGLVPLLLETSFQAQFLIPMAVSLAFGLMFTTFLVLLFVPTFYLIYFHMTGGKVAGHEDED